MPYEAVLRRRSELLQTLLEMVLVNRLKWQTETMKDVRLSATNDVLQNAIFDISVAKAFPGVTEARN
jgi:hypothetical protein